MWEISPPLSEPRGWGGQWYSLLWGPFITQMIRYVFSGSHVSLKVFVSHQFLPVPSITFIFTVSFSFSQKCLVCISFSLSVCFVDVICQGKEYHLCDSFTFCDHTWLDHHQIIWSRVKVLIGHLLFFSHRHQCQHFMCEPRMCRHDSVALEREGGGIYEWIIGNRHFHLLLHLCSHASLTCSVRRWSEQGNKIAAACLATILQKLQTRDGPHSQAAS